MVLQKLSLLAFLTLVSVASAKRRLKVLVYSPSIGYSHLQFQGKLADLLVEAGHEVHVFIPEQHHSLKWYNGTEKAHQVIRYDTPRALAASKNLNFIKNPFSGANNWLTDGTSQQFGRVLYMQCEDIVSDDSMMDYLMTQKYDVALAEVWTVCPFSLFEALGIPTRIATLAVPMSSEVADLYGIPSPMSFIPFLSAATISGDEMPYLERIRSVYVRYLAWKSSGKLCDAVDALFRNKYGADFPGSCRLMADVSLAFINANEFFDIPRPISHKTVYIGGVVERPPKALTKELEDVFATAKKGVVLFSFGSIADTTRMTEEMKQSFLTAFSNFPEHHFVWKFRMSGNDSQLLEAYPNVHAFEWIDQVSILAQPKTRAFITHCGLNSLNEAASHGVPLVTIPLFADQLYNAAVVRKKRMGVHLDILDVSAENVHSALLRVLNEPGFRQNAQLVKRKLESRPFRPAETFIRWTEFAAQHADLSELDVAGADMSLFVYHSLDVIIPSLVVVVIVVGVSFAIIQWSIRRLFATCRNLHGLMNYFLRTTALRKKIH